MGSLKDKPFAHHPHLWGEVLSLAGSFIYGNHPCLWGNIPVYGVIER